MLDVGVSLEWSWSSQNPHVRCTRHELCKLLGMLQVALSSEKSSGEGNPLGSSLSLGQDIVGSLELLPAPSDLKAWLCLAVAPALAPRARHKCPSAEKCREREKY